MRNAEAPPISRDADVDPVVAQADRQADQMAVKSVQTAPANTPARTAGAPASPQAAGASKFHESARAQVSGTATFVDDMAEIKGTLYAAPVMSRVAHGRLLAIDSAEAEAMPGVRAVMFAQDLPGETLLASFAGDEPVFAIDTVQHVGQVIGLVIADTVMQARRAARKVNCTIEALPAVLNVRDALQAQSYVLPPVFVARGDAAQALNSNTYAAWPARSRRSGAFLP